MDPTQDSQTGAQDKEEGESSNLAPIIIAVVIIGIIAAGAALFFLHVKKLLPQGFYNTFGPRWKPVNTSDEDAEDESKHPNILKNKEDLDETAKVRRAST